MRLVTMLPNLEVSQEDRMFVFKKQSRLLHRQFRQIQEFRLATYRRNLELSDGLQRIIHDDLNLFPYKVQITNRSKRLHLSIRLKF